MDLINNAQHNSKIPDSSTSESTDSTNNDGVKDIDLQAYVKNLQKERGTNEKITYKGKVLYTPKNGRPSAEFRIEPGINRPSKPANIDCTESASSSGTGGTGETGSLNKFFKFAENLLLNMFEKLLQQPWNPWNPSMTEQPTNNTNYGGVGSTNFPSYTSNPLTDNNQTHPDSQSGTGSVNKFFKFVENLLLNMFKKLLQQPWNPWTRSSDQTTEASPASPPPTPPAPPKAAKPHRHHTAPANKPPHKSLWDKTIGKALRHIF